jgi:PAS domain S-box-containing protein
MTRGGVSTGGHRVDGLDRIPLPAAACDSAARILWTNAQFDAICGHRDPNEPELAALAVPVEASAEMPSLEQLASGESRPLEVELAGAHHTMHVSVFDEIYLCVFTPGGTDQAYTDAYPPAGARPPAVDVESDAPATRDSKLLAAFIRLSRELNLAMREDELVKMFADVYEQLLPDTLVSIRLLEPDRAGLKLVYANGRLKEGEREQLRVTARSLEEVDLDAAVRERLRDEERIAEVDEYETVFLDSEGGFEVPLCDRANFYGTLNFEYRQPDFDLRRDQQLVIPLAHQMTAALRNARLLAETTFLKDYLEKLLDRANAPVLVLDRRRRITVVNQAMEQQTLHNREDILGEDFMALVPEDDRPRLLPGVIDAMRGQPTSNIEVRLPKADGSGTAHIAFNTATILSPFGDIEGVIFVGQDLTEVRQLQKQVIHTEKLATLGQVAAGVAHELNNPLTSITVYGNYLLNRLMGEIDQADAERLKRIVEAAERIQSFTKDLVTYARPSGEEPTLIQLDDLIERALSFCEHLIGEHGADVTLDVAEEVPPVYGIRGQLEQVFVNLLTNACHSLTGDGGSIVVSAKPLGDDQVLITIEDSGHGIAGEHLEHVFEPFFTTKDQGEGTGLGLSIVRNILDNHHAEIDVESELGRGTRFKITMFAG